MKATFYTCQPGTQDVRGPYTAAQLSEQWKRGEMTAATLLRGDSAMDTDWFTSDDMGFNFDAERKPIRSSPPVKKKRSAAKMIAIAITLGILLVVGGSIENTTRDWFFSQSEVKHMYQRPISTARYNDSSPVEKVGMKQEWEAAKPSKTFKDWFPIYTAMGGFGVFCVFGILLIANRSQS